MTNDSTINRARQPAPGSSKERVSGTPVKRRSVLQGLSALIGLGGVPSWVFAVGQSKEQSFFSASQLALVTALADTLIPDTDTPGAVAAGVPAGFEGLMIGWASADRKQVVLATLKQLRADLDQRAGESFVLASADVRLRALTALDKEAYANAAKRHGHGWQTSSTLDAAEFAMEPGNYDEYRFIKQLMVRLYYASKIGATEELRYDPFPGGYKGDVPFDDIGRTWATIEVGVN